MRERDAIWAEKKRLKHFHFGLVALHSAIAFLKEEIDMNLTSAVFKNDKNKKRRLSVDTSQWNVYM